MLKEYYPYKNKEIQVMVVPQDKCDNTYIGRGIDPYSPTPTIYPKDCEVITVKKGGEIIWRSK